MKKVLAVSLIIWLVSFTNVFALSEQLFPDIGVYENGREAVLNAYGKGVISGYEDGTFRPDSIVNRAELMQIVAQMKGYFDLPREEFNNCFVDVLDPWYSAAICFGLQQGWIDGYPDKTFRPANSVSRAEAIKIIIGAYLGGDIVHDELAKAANPLWLPSDIDSSAWYFPYAKYAFLNELLDLTHMQGGDLYAPHDGMTRLEVVEMINNLNRGVSEYFVDAASTSFSYRSQNYELDAPAGFYLDEASNQFAQIDLLHQGELKYMYKNNVSADLLSRASIRFYENKAPSLNIQQWSEKYLQSFLPDEYLKFGATGLNFYNYDGIEYLADFGDYRGRYVVFAEGDLIVVFYFYSDEDFIWSDFEDLLQSFSFAKG